jgi:GH18 family chitinase
MYDWDISFKINFIFIFDSFKFTREAGVLSYYEICETTFIDSSRKRLRSGWRNIWDSQQLVPYAYSGTEWISYESRDSYKSKIELSKYFGLGGVAIYTLDYDDFSGKFCGKGTYPVISYVKRELNKPPELDRTTPNDVDTLRKMLARKCSIRKPEIKLASNKKLKH